jgi:hypothetical protein
VYLSKIEAYAEFVGIGNAFDPILMVNCLTWLEFTALGMIRPDNQTLVDLCKANKKLFTTITLGQSKSHGMVFLSKTNNNDFPSRLTWELGVYREGQKCQ